MLIKKLCQRCYEKWYNETISASMRLASLKISRNLVNGPNSECVWNKDDEKLWSDGKIFCVVPEDNIIGVRGRVGINADPPIQCPYRLEHVVNQEVIEND